MMAAVIFVVTILSAVISVFLTAPFRTLSRTTRKIAGGAGIMFGLAIPIFAVLKSLNILRRPAGEKNNPDN